MAITGQDIGDNDDRYYAGDSLDMVVDVTEDGSAKDLTGASVEWAMSANPGSTEELSDSDTGVTASVTDAANGEVTVTIAEGTTNGLERSWYHEVRITDSSGDKAVVTRGTFTIASRVNQ